MSPVNSLTGARPAIYCVIPAAGVGKRMQSQVPKQYLSIQGKTVLEHTITRLSMMPFIAHIVVAIGADDPYFSELNLSAINSQTKVTTVVGGKERADSVLAGLKWLSQQTEHDNPWVLVHDAARPNLSQSDVEKLVVQCLDKHCGGILATPVRDTMKRGGEFIDRTESRDNLWHALTPQFFPVATLYRALSLGLEAGVNITDEASAMEHAGHPVLLIEGRADNLKITRPEDLALASFYLAQTATQQMNKV